MTRVIASLLIVLVALTAQGAAHTRAMPDASGQMVICTGTGPVMVYVDETGAPVAAPHICPEFALSLLLSLDAPEPQPTALGSWQRAAGDSRVTLPEALSFSSPQARGPPLSI